MTEKGKYVRRIVDYESDDDDDASPDARSGSTTDASDKENHETSHYDPDDLSVGIGSDPETVGANSDRNATDSDSEASSSSSYSTRSPSEPPSTPQATPPKDLIQTASERANSERFDRMERMIADMSNALTRFQANVEPLPSDDVDKSWKLSNDVNQRGNSESTPSNIRWDHLKPFPSGIASSKMWEEWNRYVEKFEVAVSLNNVNDPVKRTQLLFLSMGDELQGIVKAAKLRPSLSNANCYRTFVTNIQNYLRTMTDTSAEHEAFSRMKQEVGESAVSFHSRLMGKVRSCNYIDEDRFVRAQLLTGLRNRELVKQARIYGHDTNFIVQSATRDETYESETRQQDESSVLAVGMNRGGRSYDQYNRKRLSSGIRAGGPPPKQQRRSDNYRGSQGQRSRCTRCSLFNHRNGQCPALTRNCNVCGKRGHYAAACRQKQLNIMQRGSSFDRLTDNADNDNQDSKQLINALTLEDVMVACSIGSSSPIRFLIDSGADVNVIGGSDWEQLEQEFRMGKAKLEFVSAPSEKLHAYGSKEPMAVKCSIKAKIETTDSAISDIIALFHVVPKGKRSLLGRATSSDMGLLHIGGKVNNCEQQNKAKFPKMPGVKVKFSIDPSVPATKSAYYNVPAAYR
ncbi:uncharacterized protein LOC134288426 [Aedes albopictus]|uniref:CCHC-type domain-containing protein n=1 Tax=Aedes albopictus TaxID=7160 RepID=A0ABM1ZU01_AEDAL